MPARHQQVIYQPDERAFYHVQTKTASGLPRGQGNLRQAVEGMGDDVEPTLPEVGLNRFMRAASIISAAPGQHQLRISHACMRFHHRRSRPARGQNRLISRLKRLAFL